MLKLTSLLDKQSLKNYWLVIPFIPAFYFLLQVIFFSENIAAWDDFDSIFHFLNKYITAQGLNEKWALIISQHNEHRIVFNKVITILTFWFLGHIDFNVLVIVANVILVIFYALIIDTFWKRHASLSALLIATCASLIIFQPQYGDGMLWATTALSSFPVTLFALLSLCFLNREGSLNFFLGSLVALLTTFTQGNGILVLPTTMMMFLLTKRYAKLVAWIPVSAAIAFLFFHNYEANPHHHPLEGWIEHGWKIYDYLFSFIGSSLGFSNHNASFAAGALLLVLFMYLFYRSYHLLNPQLFFLMLFLFATAGTAALSRSAAGVQFALSPGRYTLISTLLTALTTIGLYEIHKDRANRILLVSSIVIFSILFSFYSYRTYRPALESHQTRLILDLALWGIGQKGLTYPWYHHAIPNFEASLENGSYDLDTINLGRISTDPNLTERISHESSDKNIPRRINRLEFGPQMLLLEGWAFHPDFLSSQTDLYFILSSTEDRIIIEPRYLPRGDVQMNFGSDRGKSGILALIQKKDLPTMGKYRVGFIIKYGENILVKYSKKFIDFSSYSIKKIDHRIKN